MTEIFQQAEFWTALALFLVLFFTWKPVRDVLLPHLDERSAAIAQDIEEVRVAFEQIQRSSLEAREKLNRSEFKVQEILANGKATAAQQHQRTLAQAQKDIATRQALSKEKIRQMEIRALDSLRDYIIRQSIQKVRKQLDEKVSVSLDQAMIARSIQHLPKDIISSNPR